MNGIFRPLTVALLVAMALLAGKARAADEVPIGILNGASSWALLIADEKGYFKEAGITPSFLIFDSGAKMIPSLATGDLAIGAGSASSGLYNAVERGIAIKIVADAVRNVPGYGEALLVRSDLIDSGAVKSIADLKGRKVAITAAASTEASSLNQAMKSAGLTYDDVDKVYLGFPDHLAAFRNGGIDASLTGEPNATAAIEAGVAKLLMGVADYYPNSQVALTMFSGKFAADTALAHRFTTAYLRAMRDYNDALEDGHLAGSNAADIIAILTKRSNIHDAKIIRTMRAHGLNPDGWVNEDSIKIDWDFFLAQKQISGKIGVKDVLDRSFVDAAVAELGPYRKKSP